MNTKIYPKHFKSQIIELANQGISPSIIAKTFNLNKNAVQTMLFKLNYKFIKTQTPQFYKKEILLLLNEGLHPPAIALKLNLKLISTQQMCTKLGFSFRMNQGNIRYFNSIDDNLKAYFLGFIAADGAIVNNSLTITIHRKDRIILDKFKEELQCDHEVKEIKTPMGFDRSRNVDHVRFVITNKDLINDLNNLGIFPRKSMTIGNIILNISEQFRNSFIVGYLDGDGCILLPKGNHKLNKKQNKIVFYPSYSVRSSFRGTLPFLQGIKDHLQITSTICFHKTHVLNIGSKKDIVKLFKCYNNLNFYLNRKYDKFFPRINHISYRELMQD